MTSAGDIIAGRYRIDAPIGEGGMGAVFRATHVELGRTVAVKLVRAEDPSEQALERFLREAKSAASVDHRNVVDVLDYGREEQPHGEVARPYLVMECLAGESLEARLKRTPPPTLDEIVEWTAGALSGLAAIHDAGIVHRDLKPANVFLAEDADGIVPKVLDFGIARPSQEASALTHTMQTLGTPHYMSPEQVRSAKTVDARSDLYSIGVMLYLAITGKLPFDGPSATAVIAAIVTDDPVPVLELRPDVPPALARIVHKAMARTPSERWASAREMRQALLDAQRGLDPSISADRPSFTQAPTVLAGPPSAMTGASSAATSPRARTGRRGFFAMLGVLSTLLVVGLAGSMVLRTGSMAPPSDAATSPTPASRAEAPAPSSGRGAPTTGTTSAVPATPAVSPPTPAGAVPNVEGAALGPEIASAPMSLEDAALAVRALGAADRAAVRVGTDGERYWLVGPSALGHAWVTDGETRVATERLVPTLMRTTVRANIREAASEEASLLATVPAETLVIALGPETGAEGDASRWARVVVAEGLTGHVASSLLAPHGGCVPDAAVIGAAHTWVSRARVHLAGGVRDALLLFDPRGGGTLRIESVDPICSTEPIARFELPSGRIADLFLTRTAEDGETLVALGRWPSRDTIPADGTMSWSVHPLSAPDRTVLELDLRSGQNLPDARRTGIGGPEERHGSFFPVRVREHRVITYYVWDGSALVPAPENRLTPAE